MATVHVGANTDPHRHHSGHSSGRSAVRRLRAAGSRPCCSSSSPHGHDGAVGLPAATARRLPGAAPAGHLGPPTASTYPRGHVRPRPERRSTSPGTPELGCAPPDGVLEEYRGSRRRNRPGMPPSHRTGGRWDVRCRRDRLDGRRGSGRPTAASTIGDAGARCVVPSVIAAARIDRHERRCRAWPAASRWPAGEQAHPAAVRQRRQHGRRHDVAEQHDQDRQRDEPDRERLRELAALGPHDHAGDEHQQPADGSAERDPAGEAVDHRQRAGLLDGQRDR